MQVKNPALIKKTFFMKKSDLKLVISEVFYSIQGEGRYMGVRSVFLRTAGCNILCKGNGWICDSIEVWKKGDAKQFKDVLSEHFVAQLRDGAHLVITGGEPLIHATKLACFIDWFINFYGFKPFIQVETNATINPLNPLDKYIDWYNISPKLQNSGVSAKQAFNFEALTNFEKITREKRGAFKFVISCLEEVYQTIDLTEAFEVEKDFVYLMPACDNVTDLQNKRMQVIDWCLYYGFHFSDRLHIQYWNQKTGV